MTNEIATRAPRLPMPAHAGVDAAKWRVLTDAVFPNARSAEAVLLAIDYCKARGLDVLKKPVNIVPMWNSQLGREVETIWPSINETQVTAARTGQWAGMDTPKWGPDVSETFEGQRKTKQGWQNAKATVTFPEWCSVTVYRLIGGEARAFTEQVFWKEAFARVGGSTLPNDMWCKRPRGQLHKVAKAAALRSAFPEEGDHTDEEMEGQTIDATPLDGGKPAPAPADNWRPPPPVEEPPPGEKEPPQEEPPHDPETGELHEGREPGPLGREEGEEWRSWGERFIKLVRLSTSEEAVTAWMKANEINITAMLHDAPKVHTLLTAAVGKHRVALAEQQK